MLHQTLPQEIETNQTMITGFHLTEREIKNCGFKRHGKTWIRTDLEFRLTLYCNAYEVIIQFGNKYLTNIKSLSQLQSLIVGLGLKLKKK